MNSARMILFVILVAVLVSPAFGQMFWNQAASFNGVASYIAVHPSSTLNITGSFTLEAWINPNAVTVDYAGIVSKGSPTLRRYSLNFANGTFANRIEIATNGSPRIRSSRAISAGVWTHVAGAYNASTNVFSIFINGLLDTSATVAGVAPADGPTDSTFVGRISVGGRYFGGMIDDARVWNRALSATEVRRWMRTELGSSTGVYSGLVLSLIFQSSANNTSFNLYDFSNNNNTSVNRGAAAVSFANRPYTYTTMNDCILLAGTDDYLAAPSTSDFLTTGSFTLECWVNPTNAISPSAQIVVSKRVLTSNTNGYDMYLSSGRVAIRTNGTTRLVGTTVIPSGYWSHIAATFNASTNLFAVYVNGNLDASATVTNAVPAASPDSLFIGHGFNSNYTGYIDEVRIIPSTLTQQQIRSFMTKSMEYSNRATGAIVYNFDGLAYVNTNNDGAPVLQFRGNAGFTTVSTVSNQPLSPLLRADAQNFPQGFHTKYSNRRIPQSGTSGSMVADSLYVSQSVNISDLNVYLATNHTFDSDLEIRLVAPAGDSVNVCFDYSMVDQNDNIVTVFDDQADSSLLVGGPFTSVAPAIRPQNSLNTGFSGQNAQGWWKLKITDDASGDTGRVYFWGIQINNQSLVGVEEVAGLSPVRYTLDQNYPNPFNPITTIQFSVPIQSVVKVKVFDILGREVRTLVDESKDPGSYKVQFDATGFSSGTYFYRMEAGGYLETRKLLLLK